MKKGDLPHQLMQGFVEETVTMAFGNSQFQDLTTALTGDAEKGATHTNDLA